jgi:stage II sporulation protein D
MSLQEFYERLGIKYNDVLDIKILSRSNTNRVLKININNNEISGRDMYNKLGLRSTDFEIKRLGSNVIIKTKGYGHGVGMSQYGAQGMAKEGYNYKEILSHYYVDTNINKII